MDIAFNWSQYICRYSADTNSELCPWIKVSVAVIRLAFKQMPMKIYDYWEIDQVKKFHCWVQMNSIILLFILFIHMSTSISLCVGWQWENKQCFIIYENSTPPSNHISVLIAPHMAPRIDDGCCCLLFIFRRQLQTHPHSDEHTELVLWFHL